MAINKKLITFATRDNFDTRLANNEINNTSIVFIQDTGELWTHGQFFCTTATNLLEAPVLTTSGDTIAVQIGDKTSNYIVPPAALKGRTMYECVTNTSDTRGHWTGTIPGVTALYDGLVIHVRFTTNYYGNSEGYNTLNINNLGPKLLWYRQSTLMTSHWGTNAELTLTYRTGAGSYKVTNANGELTNGTTYTDGWVADYAYYTNDVGYYHRRIYPNIKAGPNKIFPYTLIMQLPDGRWESIVTSSSTGTSKAKNTSGFLLGHVLAMYANATYNENANVATYNIWSAHSGLIDHRYSFNTANNATNGTTGYKPLYLVGTVTDGLFYLDTVWWTQTLPNTEDNKVYIYIGDAYDYYRMTFTEDKPIYIYKNGKIQLYSQYASETEWANITGKPATFTPSTHTHAYTDLTGSTTTANLAIVSNGTANGWTLKTLGSHAFDSTGYVKLSDTEQTIESTISSYSKGIIEFYRSSGDHIAFISFANKVNNAKRVLGSIGFYSGGVGKLQYRSPSAEYYDLVHGGNVSTYVQGSTITLSTTAQTFLTVKTGLSGSLSSTTTTIKLPATDPYTSARTPTAHTHYATTYKDSRNDVMTPSVAAAVNGVAIDFKTKANGVNAGTGLYCGLVTFDPYSDVSGGYPLQMGFNSGADSSNTNELYIRTVKDTNTWNDWRTVITSKNIGSLSVSSATNATYAANVGAAGTAGTNYVTAAKVIAACNWYDTVTGSDSDSILNRWDEIVNFVSGFEETPDLATYLSNNYLAKTGNSTSSPMTGTIYVKDVNPLVLLSTNLDLDIWRVTGDNASNAWDNAYGFYLRYNGTGNSNDNSLSLWANNQTGNDVEVYRVKLDGVLNFLTAPIINGTAISLTTHNHDDRYLKLTGGTLTGELIIDSNTIGGNPHLSFTRSTYSYIKVPTGGTLSFAVGDDTSVATTYLAVTSTAVYPGAHNKTINLGTTDYRWNITYTKILGLSTNLICEISDGSRVSVTNYSTVPTGFNAKDFMASDTFTDYTKVPTNGIYAKGNIRTAGNIQVGTGGTNSYVASDSASNIYLHNSSGAVLVVDGLTVRCASATANATLGASDRPWNSLYVNTININSNKGGAEHINFNRAGYNYVNIPTNGTFAVSFNTSTIANSYFTVEQSATYPGQHNGTVDLGTSSYQWNNLYAKTIYQNGSSIDSLYVTSVGVTDDATNHPNLLRYVKNGTSTYFTVPFATSATTANNLSKSTLGYLYQSATNTTSATGTVTATSGKIGVPIQFYGSQVNYALNNDLFYATVASNTITSGTIYLGDDIKSTNFVETSAHIPTGASSGSSSSSGTQGESITYTAGDGIKITGTLISTNTWTGTESLFAELSNPGSYDLIYIIED